MKHGNVRLLAKEIVQTFDCKSIFENIYNIGKIYLNAKKLLCSERFAMVSVLFSIRKVFNVQVFYLRNSFYIEVLNDYVDHFETILSRREGKCVAVQPNSVLSDCQNHANGRWKRILNAGVLNHVTSKHQLSPKKLTSQHLQ